MFGHEKGAFTAPSRSASDVSNWRTAAPCFWTRWARSARAANQLLRVLQEREFERLGSSRTIRTDAAWWPPQPRSRRHGGGAPLPRDLYYRLNVFPITVPPLRDRPTTFPCWCATSCSSTRAA